MPAKIIRKTVAAKRKRKPQDATLRNVRSADKRLTLLENGLRQVRSRVTVVEKAAGVRVPKTVRATALKQEIAKRKVGKKR